MKITHTLTIINNREYSMINSIPKINLNNSLNKPFPTPTDKHNSSNYYTRILAITIIILYNKINNNN